jgi:hypothetical protein
VSVAEFELGREEMKVRDFTDPANFSCFCASEREYAVFCVSVDDKVLADKGSNAITIRFFDKRLGRVSFVRMSFPAGLIYFIKESRELEGIPN